MKNIEEKIKNLRSVMEKCDIFQEGDEVGIALREVEDTLKTKTIEVFSKKEDARMFIRYASAKETKRLISEIQENSITKTEGDMLIIVDELGILN